MKHAQLFILTLLLSTLVFAQEDGQKRIAYLPEGDLSHWQLPSDNIWWTLEGTTLYAKSDPEQIGSILWTKEEFTDFMVEVDFKFGEGTIDSGIFMRGEDQHNPQIQIGISGSLKRDMTGSPYVPKQGYPVEAQGVQELLLMHDWNSLKAMAQGNSYRVWLNGTEIMNYQMEGANLKGAVGLQLHPNRDMTIAFRNIYITRLK